MLLVKVAGQENGQSDAQQYIGDGEQGKGGSVSEECLASIAGKTADPEAEPGDRALLTAMKHKSWLEARSVSQVCI